MVYIASDGQVINIYQRSTIYQGMTVRNLHKNHSKKMTKHLEIQYLYAYYSFFLQQ